MMSDSIFPAVDIEAMWERVTRSHLDKVTRVGYSESDGVHTFVYLTDCGDEDVVLHVRRRNAVAFEVGTSVTIPAALLPALASTFAGLTPSVPTSSPAPTLPPVDLTDEQAEWLREVQAANKNGAGYDEPPPFSLTSTYYEWDDGSADGDGDRWIGYWLTDAGLRALAAYEAAQAKAAGVPAEMTEWTPKVGDRVRVKNIEKARRNNLMRKVLEIIPDDEYSHEGEISVKTSSGEVFFFFPDDLELAPADPPVAAPMPTDAREPKLLAEFEADAVVDDEFELAMFALPDINAYGDEFAKLRGKRVIVRVYAADAAAGSEDAQS